MTSCKHCHTCTHIHVPGCKERVTKQNLGWPCDSEVDMTTEECDEDEKQISTVTSSSDS